MIKKIILFFEKIFNKENSVKKIESKTPVKLKQEKNIFFDSLKGSVVSKEKKTVEVKDCYGDGLGIQTKINY